MPHPRPAGAPDALSVLLREATSVVHKEAEQRPFMKAFFAGQLPRDAYIGWLARQWHLYDTLESRLAALPPDSPEGCIVPAALHRAARIESDLDHWTAGGWRDVDHCTDATAAYVARIDKASAFPPGLVAHAWLRYMGNVGGRDVLRRLAASSLGVDGDDASQPGLAFTDFSAVGEIRPFFASFHGALDGLGLGGADAARVVAEAEAGFRLNIALTDELAEDFGIR